MQQSKKMQAEDEGKKESYIMGADLAKDEADCSVVCQDGPVKIRPIVTYNSWIAILQEHQEVKGGLVVKEEALARPEGIVVGVPVRSNDENPCQVKIGDRVAFQPRSILQGFTPASDSDSPYRGMHVVILSEVNIIYKLPPVPFEVIN